MVSLKELKSEWKRIHWPSPKETVQKTGIVIAFTAVYTAFFGLVDLLLFKLRAWILDLLE